MSAIPLMKFHQPLTRQQSLEKLKAFLEMEVDVVYIGRRIAIFNSGIGYQILSRHTDRISDIGYRISESDIIRQMIKKPLDGNAKLKQKTA